MPGMATVRYHLDQAQKTGFRCGVKQLTRPADAIASRKLAATRCQHSVYGSADRCQLGS